MQCGVNILYWIYTKLFTNYYMNVYITQTLLCGEMTSRLLGHPLLMTPPHGSSIPTHSSPAYLLQGRAKRCLALRPHETLPKTDSLNITHFPTNLIPPKICPQTVGFSKDAYTKIMAIMASSHREPDLTRGAPRLMAS